MNNEFWNKYWWSISMFTGTVLYVLICFLIVLGIEIHRGYSEARSAAFVEGHKDAWETCQIVIARLEKEVKK